MEKIYAIVLLQIGVLIGLAAAQSIELTDITYTNPADPADVTFEVGTASTFTFTATMIPTDGGVAVDGVEAFFSNDDFTVTSDPVTATGVTTADAGATEIVGAIVEITLDAENCAVYTVGCIQIQVDHDVDDNESNHTACAPFGAEGIGYKGNCVNDVSMALVVITNPSDPADIVYKVGEATTNTITVTLGQYNGGIAVTGVQTFFSNDDKSVTSDPIALTGVTTADADETTIVGAVLTVTMDAENCESYTKGCIRILTDPADSDPDSDNDDGCAPFGSTLGTIGVKDCSSGFMAKFNTSLLIASLLCALNFTRK